LIKIGLNLKEPRNEPRRLPVKTKRDKGRIILGFIFPLKKMGNKSKRGI